MKRLLSHEREKRSWHLSEQFKQLSLIDIWKVRKTLNNNNHNQVFWARVTEHPPANHCFNENHWSATWFWSLRKTLDSNDQNQVADQRFSLKQWLVGGAQSRGLRKPGWGHFYYFKVFRSFAASTGFEPMTSAMLCQLSGNKATRTWKHGHCLKEEK